MKNMSDKELDELFVQAAQNVNVPYDDEAWTGIVEILNAESHSSGLAYFKLVASVLLFLIVLVGFSALIIPTFIHSNQVATDQHIGTTAVETPISKETKSISIEDKIEEPANADQQSNTLITSTENAATSQVNKAGNFNNAADAYVDEFVKEQEKNSNGQSVVLQEPSMSLRDPHLLDKKNSYWDYPQGNGFPIEGVVLESDEVSPKQLHFGLKLMYAPDLSSVGYFSPAKAGYNFGLLFTYNLSPRWMISTGAIISSKKYEGSDIVETSYQSNYPIDYLTGQCKVIDIPVNLTYQIVAQKPLNLYISAGLSSYLMQSEDYTFEYEYYGNSYVTQQNLGSENQHFLGVANFSFTVEKPITSNWSIQLEPFLKAPLTGIGAGKVDLVTSGAFLNLNYNFNPYKP